MSAEKSRDVRETDPGHEENLVYFFVLTNSLRWFDSCKYSPFMKYVKSMIPFLKVFHFKPDIK